MRDRRARFAATGIWLATMLCVPLMHGQAPAFEVASIRFVPATSTPTKLHLDPRSLRVGATPKWLIAFAFDIPATLVEGCPPWAEAEFFDIDARSGKSGDANEIKAMLRSLLGERFGLKYHREAKMSPGYLLVVGDKRRLPKESDPGMDADGDGSIALSAGTLTGRAASLTSLSEFIWSGILHAPVQNATGLSGIYDFTIPFDRRDPDCILATIRAIGLNLKKTKLRLDYLHVDSLHLPSPN